MSDPLSSLNGGLTYAASLRVRRMWQVQAESFRIVVKKIAGKGRPTIIDKMHLPSCSGHANFESRKNKLSAVYSGLEKRIWRHRYPGSVQIALNIQ